MLDRLGIVVGLLAFIGTAYSAAMWLRQFHLERRLREPILIRLIDVETGVTLYDLPYQPPRSLVTRAEVLGLLGMIPSAETGQRYEWDWLHTREFMERLEDVHFGRRDRLEIPLRAGEFQQLRIARSEH